MPYITGWKCNLKNAQPKRHGMQGRMERQSSHSSPHVSSLLPLLWGCRYSPAQSLMATLWGTTGITPSSMLIYCKKSLSVELAPKIADVTLPCGGSTLSAF